MIRDLQVNPFTNELLLHSLMNYNKVPYTIPSTPNYPQQNPNMYIIFLDEAPYLDDRTNYPITVTNAAETITFTEVQTEPQSQYEFRIAPFGSLIPIALQFHPSAAGMGIKVTYSGYGSVVRSDVLLSKSANLSDVPDKAAARDNLNVYSKTEVFTRTESNNRFLIKDAGANQDVLLTSNTSVFFRNKPNSVPIFSVNGDTSNGTFYLRNINYKKISMAYWSSGFPSSNSGANFHYNTFDSEITDYHKLYPIALMVFASDNAWYPLNWPYINNGRLFFILADTYFRIYNGTDISSFNNRPFKFYYALFN